MTSWPFEHSLEVGGIPYLQSCFRVEGGIVYRLDDLAGCLVAQCKEMGEVILAELVIVREQPFYTPVAFNRGLFGDSHRHSCQGLNFPAMFLPPFKRLLLFFCPFSRHSKRVFPC